MFNLSNLHIGQSRTLLYICSGVHFIALYSIFVSFIPAFHKSLFSLFVVMSFAYFIYNRLCRDSSSIVSIGWSAENGCIQLFLRDGMRLDVAELKQTSVLPFVICLLCKVEERLFPIPVIVFWDACTPQEFRRLRVLALHRSVKPNGEAVQ